MQEQTIVNGGGCRSLLICRVSLETDGYTHILEYPSYCYPWFLSGRPDLRRNEVRSHFVMAVHAYRGIRAVYVHYPILLPYNPIANNLWFVTMTSRSTLPQPACLAWWPYAFTASNLKKEFPHIIDRAVSADISIRNQCNIYGNLEIILLTGHTVCSPSPRM